MTDLTVADLDALPPTQYLIIETLTARMRLGEPFWPFPEKLRRPLAQLDDIGLITVERHSRGQFKATPTAALRKLVESSKYRPPTIADGTVRDAIRHCVAAHLTRAYGTVSADTLRPVPAIPRDVVALADWLTQGDEDADD